jgi:hypothetical protein
MAEIQPIKYSKELQKQLFPDNSFYKHAVMESGIADSVKTVERPYQNSIGEATVGEVTKLPVTINTAVDGKDEYSTTLITAPPIVVDLPGEFALNYNKRQSKQVQQASVINTSAAAIAATNWGPTKSSNLLYTTGSARASNVATTAGSVIANRKAATKADMIKVQNLMMRMNMSGMPGMLFALVTADFYSDLLALAEFTDYDKTGQTSKLEKGLLGRIMNFEIMTRSSAMQHTGLVYSAAGVKHAVSDSVISTDCPANLFWNDKMVAVAEGAVKTSVNTKAPGYQGGTVLEAWTRFGASWARYDQAGVIALLEDNE